MKRGKDYTGVSVGVMLFNAEGKLFLALRGRGASNEAGYWETPGGSVEFGETLEAAVRREIREEYGIEFDIVEQFPAVDHLLPEEGQHWVATTFLARLPDGQEPRIMEPHKCAAIGWFDLDRLPSPLSRITQMDLAHYGATHPTVPTTLPRRSAEP
jgi:8-oxo-dGTP diphosphatase